MKHRKLLTLLAALAVTLVSASFNYGTPPASEPDDDSGQPLEYCSLK